jgi:adenosylcobinamide hydrolase
MPHFQTSNWESLRETVHFALRRSGRYLVAELIGPHLVLSTSVRNGGFSRSVNFLGNHQSCEGTAHLERQTLLHDIGQERYHDLVCADLDLSPDKIALMGTAANMNYAAVVSQTDRDLAVTAVVTAGVQGNAACAGDPAGWREEEGGWEKIGGTINTMLLINQPLTDAAMARSAVTMTEAKTAALQRLAVGSLYSSDLATGTGTDQFAIAAFESGGYRLTSASQHVKLGELIGCTVRDATSEALRWQNGLEPSYTRSIFTALGRFGLKEASFFEQIEPMLSPERFALMQKNSRSVFYEPLVAAGAYAFAAVLDRARYGMLPTPAIDEALRQQAASMAVSLSTKTHLWEQFRSQLTQLHKGDEDHMHLVLASLALGWSAKWSS